MRFRVLGCSGGIGGGRHTTSFLLDDDILVDAGTGLTRLTLDEMGRIDHLFLTHAHLDHTLCLPTLLDSVGDRERPLVIHAIPEVLTVLREHIFNWHVWPDFTRVPKPERPFMTYSPLVVEEPVRVGEREITPIHANHGRPAVGYLLRGAGGSLLFSGDTSSHESLWWTAEATDDLKHLVVECSFANDQRELARVSNHYCPATLLPDLAGLRADVAVWITHLKPGGEEAIMAELGAAPLACARPVALSQDQVIEL